MLILFLIGLIIALSGVLIPGPLLFYTISESLRRGFIGHVVMSAHALIEMGIVAAILVGISPFLSNQLTSIAGSIGGVALLLFGSSYLRVKPKVEKEMKSYAPFFGGFLFTAFNPSFPLWWIAIGVPIVLESMKMGGIIGVCIMMLGHWSGDFGWYMFVSYITHRTGRFLSDRAYRVLLISMGIILIGMGAYFLMENLPKFLQMQNFSM